MKLFERRRRAMMCQELVEVLTEYLEGTLPPADRRRLEAHLQVCPHCTRYLEQFRLTIQAAGRLGTGGLPDELTNELLDAFRGWRG